ITLLYSRLDKEVTNFSLTVLHEIASLIHCADLCSRDDYCMEFVYSEISRHCIGLHCLKTDNYAYQYVSPTPYRGLYFGKVSNSVAYSGHHYFYLEENVTWAEAKVECQKKCAHLVEIETKAESDWLPAPFVG
ncbi:uncharacterized protein LOC128174030, partial [Crassostrea angulata]|uniref:uncharacterized protein LOC128174030 n=1 Tax=Magallana angulata TaxID=2784310 RepID=UPI0022B0C563